MTMSGEQIFELPEPTPENPVVTEVGPTDTRALSRGRLILRRFLRQKSGLLGLLMLLFVVLIAFVGPHLTKWHYDDFDTINTLAGPSSSHFFGVDDTGRDVFARTLKGLQKSIFIGLSAAVITTFIAGVAGSIAGYFGKWTDTAVVWVIDLLLVLPSFLILAILSPVLASRSWMWLVLLLSVFGWMITGRVIRGMTLSLREREYINAAKFMGVPAFTIIRRHLIPNMASLLIVDVTINVGVSVVSETTLSFFGFGVQPPDVSLGTVLDDGQGLATTIPHVFWFGATLLVLLVLSVSLIGDALREAIDPTSGSSRL
ncbi:ABC transporter permease [Jatrophihabitans telluris]|uniref:Oligopeptide transport system permease protein OppC n=1 Tax=Jatrophihabitans telluris TaxID=2038343 RepID=A0ABY4QXY9_9ACTN|nr:ABC transporter permease [Jatrophihabitans telluris]UQX87721.1 ABC transporter permease [Jatrophihabitans telluris]